MAFEYLKNIIDTNIEDNQFNTFKGFNQGNTVKVFWHQIVSGVLYQTGSGQKTINWNIEEFTNADGILDPFQPLFVSPQGKDAENLAIDIAEKYEDDDPTKAIIGYQKITKPENCRFSEAKILFDDRGLKVAPNINKFTQISAQRTLRLQIEEFLDFSIQSQVFFTIPQIEENYYMYAIDLKPIYTLDNKFKFTEITLVSTADIFNSGGARLSDFIRDSGPGDLSFFPIIDKDGNIKWDEKRWNINPNTGQPLGVNTYNSQLGINDISGQAGFAGDLIIGCDFTWDNEKQIMVYGAPKILVQTQPVPTYSNELSSNALASDTFLVAEGSAYCSDVFWPSFSEKQKATADLSTTPLYQGDFITKGDKVINSNVNFKAIWDNNWTIPVGETFTLTDKDAFEESIKSLGQPEFLKEVNTGNFTYKWNTAPNFLFNNGLVGLEEFNWNGINNIDISSWYFMNSCLLNSIPEIPTTYRNIVKWNVKNIPILGSFIDWIFGGLIPSWANIISGGYGAQPIGFLCAFDIMYFALKTFYPKGDSTLGKNYGTIPMNFFDNTTDGYKIPGQQASTSIAFRLTDQVKMKPYNADDGTLLPEETIDTSLIGRTTQNAVAPDVNKFYGLGKDTSSTLNWTKLNTPKGTDGSYKGWVIVSQNSKHIGMTNWQLSYAYLKDDNTNISSDNLVWQGTYKTMSLYRTSIRDYDMVLSLMNFNNTNVKPITNLAPILYPSGKNEGTKFFNIDKGNLLGNIQNKEFSLDIPKSFPDYPYNWFISYFEKDKTLISEVASFKLNVPTEWVDNNKLISIDIKNISFECFAPKAKTTDTPISVFKVNIDKLSIPYNPTNKDFVYEINVEIPESITGVYEIILGETSSTGQLDFKRDGTNPYKKIKILASVGSIIGQTREIDMQFLASDDSDIELNLSYKASGDLQAPDKQTWKTYLNYQWHLTMPYLIYKK